MYGTDAPPYAAWELLVVASPEERCMFSLGRLGDLPPPTRVWILTFLEYEQPATDLADVDLEACRKYQQHKELLCEWASQRQAEIVELPTSIHRIQPPEDIFGPPPPFRRPVIFDISCVSRGRLYSLLHYLARCQELCELPVSLAYSEVERHETDERAYAYGISDIVNVPGFRGKIRLRPDLLILFLGFEGNRAFSLVRRLSPHITYLIVGESAQGRTEFDYEDQTRDNNRALLRIHATRSRTIAADNPIECAQSLYRLLEQMRGVETNGHNVYLSCLGTKLQVVGSFMALRHHPYIQVVHSVATRHRSGTTGFRALWFLDAGSDWLAAPAFLTDGGLVSR